MRVSVFLFGVLVRLSPRRFRDRFGAAMVGDVREQLGEASATGRVSVVMAAARSLANLAWVVVKEWLAPGARVDAGEGVGGGAGRASGGRESRHGAAAGGERLGAEWRWPGSIVADVRIGMRSLARRPRFVALVLATLGLGVGANTALFTMVNAVLLRPLPFREPDRLVSVWEEDAERGGDETAAPARIEEWRDGIASFERVGAYGKRLGWTAVAGPGEPDALKTAWVTGDFFEVLGVSALEGRTFRDDETWSDAGAVAIVSDEYRVRRYGRGADLIGRTIVVDEEPRQIVGILPAGLSFPEKGIDVWLPMSWSRTAVRASWFREDRFIAVIARLREGATVERAAAELAVEDRTGTAPTVHTRLVPLRSALAARARVPLLLLFGFTTLLLALTCANLANLMLLRSAERSHEMSVRVALGAGRRRIMRHLLIESLLLAAAGGLIAMAVATLSIRLLRVLRPPVAWRLNDVPLDGRVLAWAFGATLGCTVLFGLLPAWRGVRAVAGTGVRTTMDASGRRLSRVLVAAEIALALVLALGATLLLRSFTVLTRIDTGYRTADRFAAQLLVPTRYDGDPVQLALAERVAGSLRSLADVIDVTYTSRLPLTGATVLAGHAAVDPAEPGVSPAAVSARTVADGYFRVLGVPILEGRAFSEADGPDAEPVVIVNETFRRHYFPNGHAVGARVTWDSDPGPRSRWYRIVGVVRDQLQLDPRSGTRMEVNFAFRQQPGRFLNMLLHVRPGARPLEPRVRERIAGVDPGLAVFSFRSIESVHDETLDPDRSLTLLTALFAGLALLLAVIGIHGVAAESVRRRTKEIGIRVALGANPRDIAGLALTESARLAVAGIAAGLLLALAGARVLAGVLFGVDPHDPISWSIVPPLLLITAVLACSLPALRAMRIEPVEAMGGDSPAWRR